MSETAPLPSRAPNLPDTPPAPQSGGEKNGQGEANGQAATPKETQKPPEFKEPAISLNPRVAGITVGDILTGQVERIDAEYRAVVQNAHDTLLVDPAADLKAGAEAKLVVTQTAPQFLGRLLQQGQTKTDTVPVQLALVALRGVRLSEPSPTENMMPVPAFPAPAQAVYNTENRIQDVVAIAANVRASQSQGNTIPQTNVSVATSAVTAKPNAQPTLQPTLIQSLVTRDATASHADQENINAFEARHAAFGRAPQPVKFTLLPASQVQPSYDKPPGPLSPINQLLKSGRALLATVERVPEDLSGTATGRVQAMAGPLRIEIPALPNLPLGKGDKIVLMSADAEPVKNHSPQSAIAPKVAVQAGPPASLNASAILWPKLHSLMATVGLERAPLTPQYLATRLSQAVFAHLRTRLETPNGADAIPAAAADTEKQRVPGEPIRQLAMEAAAQIPQVQTLFAMQSTAEQSAAISGVSGRSEGGVMPLIMPNSETSLIASLFFNAADPETAFMDDAQQSAGPERDQAQEFDVTLSFETFGRTRLSGRLSGSDLTLYVESENAFSEALQSDLTDAFHLQCDTCGFTGALNFKSAA